MQFLFKRVGKYPLSITPIFNGLILYHCSGHDENELFIDVFQKASVRICLSSREGCEGRKADVQIRV